MDGIVNFDKPAGLSSARVVSIVKRLLPRGVKIGHAGTLDPFATGVLLLLIGKATRACEKLMDSPKQYVTTMKLGATTETLDPESPEIVTEGVAAPPGQIIEALLPHFVGRIEQVPPAYSALKLAGRPAYKLARQGEAVELKPRLVQVYGIEFIEYAWPLLKLRIDCGRGTYIRSLARDIGAALNVGGYLLELRRTRVGAYGIEQAVSLEKLQADGVAGHLQAVPAP